MSRQRLNARGWAIRQMRFSVGGSRSAGGRRWNAVPTTASHGRAAVPSAAVSTRAAKMAAPHMESRRPGGVLTGKAAFQAAIA